MLPSFEVVARHRPIAVVGTVQAGGDAVGRSGDTAPLPRPAPFAAVEVALAAPPTGPVTLTLAGADGTVLRAVLDGRRVRLETSLGDGPPRTHASRRHGRSRRPQALAVMLTGAGLAALVREDAGWVVRCRVDLARLEGALAVVRDPGWLAGLQASWAAPAGAVATWTAGGAGQLGLRDVRLATHADGTPYRTGEGNAVFTATSAGPGFFDTAHTSVWELDSTTLTPRRRGALYFERPDLPGAHGEHATHLVRDGGRWLVATSTWSTLPPEPRERAGARIDVLLAEVEDRDVADLTRGEHRLATRLLHLPVPGPSVGVWDPHLVRADGGWLVGYVSARRFFDFHPVLASGPDLDHLTLRAAATSRRATEGTTLLPTTAGWRVLASDGRDNDRSVRGRYPVMDLDMVEVGTLDAPYLTNIPWPTVLPPVPGDAEGAAGPWHLVTFDGTPTGGRLPGYGTHGDLVVMRAPRT